VWPKKGAQSIHWIAYISCFAIGIASALLFIVLSAFEGLTSLHLKHTSIADPELKILPQTGKFFDWSPSLETCLAPFSKDLNFSKVVESQVLLSFKNKKHTCFLKGVDAYYSKVIATDSLVQYGDWDLDPKQHLVVVGNGIANTLGLGINSFQNPLRLFMPRAGKGVITDPSKAFRKASCYVSGIYRLTNDLDQKYVFSDLSIAQSLLGHQKLSSIDIKITNSHLDPKKIKQELIVHLSKSHPNLFRVKSREELNDHLYKMLNIERLGAFALITLVIIIALFNFVGAMAMIISDKKEHLQTLYNMGAPLHSLRYIFLFLGVIMVSVSAFIGVLLGWLLVALHQEFTLLEIAVNIPYPTEIELLNLGLVLITVISLGAMACLVSSFSVSKGLLEEL